MYVCLKMACDGRDTMVCLHKFSMSNIYMTSMRSTACEAWSAPCASNSFNSIQIVIVNKGIWPIIQHENKTITKHLHLHRHVIFIPIINNTPLSIINNFQ